jgi:hypothetical protein
MNNQWRKKNIEALLALPDRCLMIDISEPNTFSTPAQNPQSGLSTCSQILIKILCSFSFLYVKEPLRGFVAIGFIMLQ